MRSATGLTLTLLVATASAASAADPVERLLHRRGEAFVEAMNAGGEALVAFARDHLETRIAREGLTERVAERLRETVAELGPVERHATQVLRAAPSSSSTASTRRAGRGRTTSSA
jgi:hypothetical protein